MILRNVFIIRLLMILWSIFNFNNTIKFLFFKYYKTKNVFLIN